MINKRLVIVSSLFIIVVFTLISLYFRYWYEPEGQYVATDNSKLIQVRKDLDELKAGLKKEGLYDCCIRNDCNWCAVYMGHCPCGKLMSEKGNEKSCPECAAAWNLKLGRVSGRDPDAIKVTTFGIYGFEEDVHHREEGHEHKGSAIEHHEAQSEKLQLSGVVENNTRVVRIKAFKYGFTPDPVVVKLGEKVRLEATSRDVTHGIAISDLGVNFVVYGGKAGLAEFTADKAGTFTMRCSVFCGPGHVSMKGVLIVIK